jgi:pilus assembly protein CpaD
MNARMPLLLAGFATALGACATTPPEGPPTSSHADRHTITVEQTGERLDIVVAPGEMALSPKSRADLRGFAGAYARVGHGALIMSTPAGGANSDSAALIAHQTRLVLAESGVPYSAIAGSSYDASGVEAAPIILTFTRFEAVAPACAPLWEQDIGHQSNNQPWASFGCATQANLAAMIEDPHDLLAPRDEDPRDSNRRGTVMEAYRAGTPTHAERSSDERVAVSSAVSN